MNDKVNDAFTPGPMVSFRTARKPNSYVARAKLYPLERNVVRKCEVCGKV